MLGDSRQTSDRTLAPTVRLSVLLFGRCLCPLRRLLVQPVVLVRRRMLLLRPRGCCFVDVAGNRSRTPVIIHDAVVGDDGDGTKSACT